MKSIANMIQEENVCVVSDPNDHSKGMITNYQGFIKYYINDSNGHKSGQIRNSELDSIHYKINPNMNVRTIVWGILGLILSVLIYFSVETITSKITGIIICFILIIFLVIVNSSQSNKSNIIICSNKSQIIFPVKNAYKRKKEISEFINKILHNSSHKNKTNIPINIFYQNRVIPNHPSTPNELC